MTSDDDLIARVRETGATAPDASEREGMACWCLGAYDGGHIGDSQWDCLRLFVLVDTQARRIEELRDGLERIERTSEQAATAYVDARMNAEARSMLDLRAIARSLLHPEPQEDGT